VFLQSLDGEGGKGSTKSTEWSLLWVDRKKREQRWTKGCSFSIRSKARVDEGE